MEMNLGLFYFSGVVPFEQMGDVEKCKKCKKCKKVGECREVWDL